MKKRNQKKIEIKAMPFSKVYTELLTDLIILMTVKIISYKYLIFQSLIDDVRKNVPIF